MKVVLFVAALVSGAYSLDGSATDMGVLEKATQLLGSALKKSKEGNQVAIGNRLSIKQFCDRVTAEAAHPIEDDNAKIQELTAVMNRASTTATDLAREIFPHEQDIAADLGDIRAVTRVREMERASFEKVPRPVPDITKQAERKSIDAYNVLMREIKEDLSKATNARDLKRAAIARILQTKAEAEGEMLEVTARRDARMVLFESLENQWHCQQRLSDLDVQLRAQGAEIASIEEAIDIVSSQQSTASGGLEKEPASSLAHAVLLLQDGGALHVSDVLLTLAADLTEVSAVVGSVLV